MCLRADWLPALSYQHSKLTNCSLIRLSLIFFPRRSVFSSQIRLKNFRQWKAANRPPAPRLSSLPATPTGPALCLPGTPGGCTPSRVAGGAAGPGPSLPRRTNPGQRQRRAGTVEPGPPCAGRGRPRQGRQGALGPRCPRRGSRVGARGSDGGHTYRISSARSSWCTREPRRTTSRKLEERAELFPWGGGVVRPPRPTPVPRTAASPKRLSPSPAALGSWARMTTRWHAGLPRGEEKAHGTRHLIIYWRGSREVAA